MEGDQVIKAGQNAKRWRELHGSWHAANVAARSARLKVTQALQCGPAPAAVDLQEADKLERLADFRAAVLDDFVTNLLR